MAGPVSAILLGRAQRLFLSRVKRGMAEQHGCSYFVLDNSPKLGYILVYPRPTRGALARRRKSGAESGPAAGLARRRSREADLGLIAQLVRLKEPRARRRPALPLTAQTSSRATQRATLDHPQGSQLTLRALRCWIFDIAPIDQGCRSREADGSAKSPARGRAFGSLMAGSLTARGEGRL